MTGAIANQEKLVLASGSEVRRRLLENAGLNIEVVRANVDEASIRDALLANDNDIDPADVAEVLARTKADDVVGRAGARYVIAADQVLAFDGRIYEKPADQDDARAQLLALAGHAHTLHSAVVLAEDREVVWAHVDSVRVHMRAFSAAFVGKYMADVGDAVLNSVGCYQLEGSGVQLIDRIEGDYFSVLGLPMFALLRELRDRKVLLS